MYVIYCYVLSIFSFLKWTLLVSGEQSSVFHVPDKDINEEIFEDVGGKSQINLIYILKNFTDTDFVQTYDDASYIDIDSIADNLKPHEKSFSLLSRNVQIINAKFDKLTTHLSYSNE